MRSVEGVDYDQTGLRFSHPFSQDRKAFLGVDGDLGVGGVEGEGLD